MQQITPNQALNILDRATQPYAADKLNRIDYINIQLALETLDKFVQAHSQPETPDQQDKNSSRSKIIDQVADNIASGGSESEK